MKKSNAQKKDKPARKKQSKLAAYPYLYHTLIFVLISLFIFAPLMLIGLNEAKNTVADAQSYLTMGYNDLSVDESPNDKTGDDFVNSIKVGSLLGTVECEKLGLNEKVYYGENRVTLRNGAGLNSKSYLFGKGGASKVACYALSFSGLYYAEKGDVITVNSNLGNFEYTVYKTAVSKEPEETKGDVLIFGMPKSVQAFSCFADEHYYVYAKLTGEVQ